MKVTGILAPLAPLATVTNLFPAGMLFISIFIHGLVIVGFLYTGTPNNAPAQLQAVIIDLILDKSGASPNEKTQSEPKQKASVAERQSSTSQLEHTSSKPVNTPMTADHERAKPSDKPAVSDPIKTIPVPHPQKQTSPQAAASGQPASNILRINEISETQIKATKGRYEKRVITNSVTLTPNKDPDSSKSTAALQPPQKVDQSATKTKSTKIKKAKTRREQAKRKKQSNNTKPKRLARTSAHASPGAGRKHKGRAPKGLSQGTAFTGPGLSNPRPSYPAKARSKGYQGRVLLIVIVSKIGRAKSVRLKKSSGHAILDQAAIKSVKKWRFRPARKNGVPVPARVIVPVNFRLRG